MRRSLLLATSAVACLATPAWAQDSAAFEPVSDIVVTAQLREQDPTEVPIAVTAVTDDQLKRLGLNELDQAARFVPGLLIQNQSPNNPGFVVRGITSDSGTAYNEPRVSVFQDGISISKSRGSYVELFDVERLEVAKGPQSTLYGRGALVGAINIVQNKADPRALEAYGRASYGNYNQWLGEAMVNLPVGEGAAIRLAGRARERDGYTENLLGGRDFNSARTWAVRGSAHVEKGDVTFDLIGNYQKDTPAGTAFKSIAYNPTDPVTGEVIGNRGRNSGAALAPGEGFEDGRRLGLKREVGGATGILNWKLNDTLRLTSITAYREFDALEVFDADGISLPMLTAAEDAHGEQFSQELRLTFEHGPVTAFLGASYFWEDGYQRTPAQFDERVLLARLTNMVQGPIPGRAATDPAPISIFSNTAFTGALLQGVAASRGLQLPTALATAIAGNLKSAHLESSTNSSQTDAMDLFGDISVKVTDRLELGAGLRYTHDWKETGFTASVANGRSILGGLIGALSQPAAVRQQLLMALAVPGAASIPTSAAYPVPLFGLNVQPTANNGDVDSQSFDNGGFSWRVNARYELSPEASLYASYARGRRPQILSVSAPAAPNGAARFDRLPAETVDSWEAGVKTALANRTLFVDGSVFYYQYDNFQTTVQQGTTTIITNAGKAESYGFEGQARWVASPNAALFATYAYNHSRFESGVRDGNRFRLTPDHAASFGAMLGYPVGGGRVTLTPSVTWQSRVFFDDDNDLPVLQQPPAALVADNLRDELQRGYALVNARLGYEAPGGWQIEAFVENLFDKNYINDAGNTGDGLGMPTFIAGAPRYYGVAATFRFGGSR
jgi:outer membrane receptor protein involved in Fe transport